MLCSSGEGLGGSPRRTSITKINGSRTIYNRRLTGGVIYNIASLRTPDTVLEVRASLYYHEVMRTPDTVLEVRASLYYHEVMRTPDTVLEVRASLYYHEVSYWRLELVSIIMRTPTGG